MIIDPRLPVTRMTTYGLSQPLASHWRVASCEEVKCRAFQYGWRTVIDETTTEGRMRGDYIRTRSGRHFTECRLDDGLTEFTFVPGQTCFRGSQHRIPLERDPIAYVRSGDRRGNPGGTRRVHHTLDEWVEDFALHQESISETFRKG